MMLPKNIELTLIQGDAICNSQIWGLKCHKQLSRAGTSNYISQIPWAVITWPCPWYLLLAHHSSCETYTPIFQLPTMWCIACFIALEWFVCWSDSRAIFVSCPLCLYKISHNVCARFCFFLLGLYHRFLPIYVIRLPTFFRVAPISGVTLNTVE